LKEKSEKIVNTKKDERKTPHPCKNEDFPSEDGEEEEKSAIPKIQFPNKS